MRTFKYNWKYKNTNTLTLNELFDDFDDFVIKSEIEDTQEYRNIFNTLYNLYNDAYIKWNTEGYCTTWLRFIIEDEFEKYEKVNEMWDNQIEKLMGDFAEQNIFNIGDKREVGTDYDKFKSGRITNEVNRDVLDKIQQIQEMKTPFNSLIHSIVNRYFKTWNQDTKFVEIER